MKLYAAALSIFCMTSLFAGNNTQSNKDTITPEASAQPLVDVPSIPTEITSSLNGISARDAAVACGVVGVSYWMNYKLKGFIKDLPDAVKGTAGGILPRYFKSLDSKDFGPTLVREMVTGAAFAALCLGVKVLIADNLISTGADFTGDGKAIKNASPKWFEKAWTTGLSLAFAKLAYDTYHGSLAPDLIISFKKWYNGTQLPAVTPATI